MNLMRMKLLATVLLAIAAPSFASDTLTVNHHVPVEKDNLMNENNLRYVHLSKQVLGEYLDQFKAKEFETLSESYLNRPLCNAPWKNNWFLQVTGGVSTFIGTPLGCEDIFGRMKLNIKASIGKWFSPFVGARVGYQGYEFTDSQIERQSYSMFHADLMWNLTHQVFGYSGERKWQIIPYIGTGLIHNWTIHKNQFAFSYGLQNQFQISPFVSIVAELSGISTFADFDGYGRSNRLGDHIFALSAGINYTFGKKGWTRVVDAAPYIDQNKQLMEYVNGLHEHIAHFRAVQDQNLRTIAELQKILEIEGLLDKYNAYLTEYQADRNKNATDAKHVPVNDYNGLNSLRARLATEGWGNALFSQSGKIPNQSMSGVANGSSSKEGTDYIQEILLGKRCIGAPVLFFFELNSDVLVDSSQMNNLKEIARIAKKFNLKVQVTGSADSATGTADINDRLSQKRAAFIKAGLTKEGVESELISTRASGGIDTYSPAKANRCTAVRLFMNAK